MQTIWLFVSRLSSSHGMNSQIAPLASVNPVNPHLFRPNNRCNGMMVPAITHAICVIKYVSVSVISTDVQRISEIGFENVDTPLRSKRITYARSFFFYHLVSRLHLPIDVGTDEDAFRSAPGAALPENGLVRLFISERETSYRD